MYAEAEPSQPHFTHRPLSKMCSQTGYPYKTCAHCGQSPFMRDASEKKALSHSSQILVVLLPGITPPPRIPSRHDVHEFPLPRGNARIYPGHPP